MDAGDDKERGSMTRSKVAMATRIQSTQSVANSRSFPEVSVTSKTRTEHAVAPCLFTLLRVSDPHRTPNLAILSGHPEAIPAYYGEFDFD